MEQEGGNGTRVKLTGEEQKGVRKRGGGGGKKRDVMGYGPVGTTMAEGLRGGVC